MPIEAQVTEISELIRSIPSRSTRNRLKAELEALTTRHQVSEGTDTVAEAELICLRKAAAIAVGMGTCSWFMITYLLLITGGFFVGVYLYFDGLGPARYSSIEATRPILVFTLIIAMLGFGGLLIYRALFSPDSGQPLQDRFRLAREIFLVYSGIFGTIIGFYFGAADAQTAAAPRVQVAVASERQVTATVEGGNLPFLGIITLANQAGGTTMTANERMLSINLPAAPCPRDATITVVDGLGRHAEAKITQTTEALAAAGWPSCTGSSPTAPPGPVPNANTAVSNTTEVRPR